MSTCPPQTLCFEELWVLAERESGAHGLAHAELRARASAMIERFNQRGPYPPHKLEAMRRQVQRILSTRLKIALDRKRFPEIAEQAIERPIFIIGFPRSGTTLLHSLIAEDPQMLKFTSWALHGPSPPPGAGPICAERYSYARRRVREWVDFVPGLRPMHPYIDKGADNLCENEEMFSLDFQNAYPTWYFHVPTLEASDAITPDPISAYRFMRQFMQHLQWNTGKKRWVCKEPGAQMHIEALLEVFPDALCVWPHRPLVDIYASNVALRAAIFDNISGHPKDWTQQPRGLVEAMKAAFDRLMASDAIRDERILHVKFEDVANDSIAVIHAIYERLGQVPSAEFDSRVRAWLRDPENAVDRFGRYPYDYDAFGLDREWVDQLFADYSEYFGLK